MNRVTVSIADKEYTLVAEEPREYIEEIAKKVDGLMREARNGSMLTIEQAAVLTAINMADEFTKADRQAESLRRQIQSYIDENNRLRAQGKNNKKR